MVATFSLVTEELQELLLFSGTTLLANLDGCLGLITGFSYFTLVEATETLLAIVARLWQTRRKVEVIHQRHVFLVECLPSDPAVAIYSPIRSTTKHQSSLTSILEVNELP